MAEPLVRDVMTTTVLTVAPDTTVSDVARMLSERKISGLPVVQDNKVVGVVSEADLLWKKSQLHPPVYVALLDSVIPIGEGAYLDELRRAAAATAHDLMSAPPVCIVPEAPISVAASRMLEHRINRLPVVDGHGHLVGIIARGDLIRSLAGGVAG